MVVWLRREQASMATPDGIIRSSSLMYIGAADASLREIDAMRLRVVAQAQQQADEIVQAAIAGARQVERDAAKTADKLFEQAYANGRQAGIDEWSSALLKAARESQQQLRQQRERMARIVIAAVEKVVPLQDSQGIYRQVVRTLSKSMQAMRYVTVRVCPEEVVHAETALRDLAKGSALGKLIEVVADDRLTQGACLVESDQGIIDLSLDSQLKALRKAIGKTVAYDSAEAHADPDGNSETAARVR